MPACSLVAALNSLQNAMMLTPCWPSAGPTGGAGFACPAGICNLICPTTFFAIKLRLLYFPVFQFHRSVPAEHIHCHLQLAFVGIDFLDHTAEIEKRTVIDLNRFSHFKTDFRPLSI